jgi:N-acetyl-gamma-glutamyl-phosphate reductase
MSTKVGIVGFRGYSGAELVSILDRHPHTEPHLLEHRQDAAPPLQPLGFSGPPTLPCDAGAVAKEGLEVVFLATPPEVSMSLTPPLLEAGVKVIDLSGAYRLKTVENYQRWYKAEHLQPELLASAVYGLPEFNRQSVPGSSLVSNPGCYPTAANLAIRPLVRSGAVNLAAGIVCDAKSGTSGAGRKPSLKTAFCEVVENFSAYSILGHRHVPEVLMNSDLEESAFSFTAQLLPLDRGILETIYFRSEKLGSAEELLSLYQTAYDGEAFVRLYEPGQVPSLRSVQRTNFCDIGVSFDGATGRGVVVAAIDNLVKGAAGQAVQNMNLLLGHDETEGLL